jgi:phosphonate transport system ATP-binding protein
MLLLRDCFVALRAPRNDGSAGARPMLRIKGLTKRYRTGDLALKGVDVDLPDGQVMALIGPSGAGKSTVIRCINRLVEPTSGTITLNDTEITGLGGGDLRRARRRMGMIFQEYALVERLSVMENVLSGRLGYVGFWQSWLRRFPQTDIDEAFRLLARVGLDAMADKRADELSGGQRQRVGVCRALIQNPELLLVDEPTASLDPKTSRQIMRLIKELCVERKLSAIINIHDVMLAQMFAERIVGLRLGEIVYDGPPDGLTAAVLTEIYGEEDWSATIRKADDDDPDTEADNVIPMDAPQPHRDRMAGLT